MSTPDVVVWSDLRDEAVSAFASFPPAKDEAVLLEAFERSPTAVRRSYEHTLEGWQAARIRAPWRIWALECQRSRGDVAVSTAPDRGKALSRARGWLASVGLYFDCAAEVEDELFGAPQALLGPWAQDQALRSELAAEWQALRPRGEKSEQERDARAAKWRSDVERLRREDLALRQEREEAAATEVRRRVIELHGAGQDPEPPMAA